MRILCNFIIPILLLSTYNYGYAQKLKGKVKSYTDSYFAVSESFGVAKKGAKLQDSTFHDQLVAYNQNGDITHVVEYCSDGTVYCKYTARNGYKDNQIETIYVQFDKEMVIKKKPFIIESAKYIWGEWCEMDYKNDSTGLPAEEIIHDLMGSELYKILIKRDEKGNPIEYLFSNGTFEKSRYDNHGNKVECVQGSASRVSTIYTYKYDDYGNMVEEYIDDLHNSYYHFYTISNTFKYKYDKYGNWIQRIDYEQLIPKRMVIRKIEYLL